MARVSKHGGKSSARGHPSRRSAFGLAPQDEGGNKGGKLSRMTDGGLVFQ
jgi:hypothetical protein